MWLGFALLTGITFIAYFVPMTSMLSDALSLELGITTLSWIVFFTLATYINAGWAREQLCQYICPYARFQSAMFDRNTLIISYDKKRGEPRGSRKRNLSEKDIDKGACVDCKLCVQVCPTGIDIRDGLQYECISCALCIDACNNVMDKMGYARGLIRYTTEYALLNGKKITFESVFKRWKVLGYLAVLLVVISILGFRLASIEPIELIVRPDRQAILTAVDSESVSQRYQIKIVNKKDEYLKAKLTLDAGDYYVLHAPDLITLPASQVITFPVSIELSKDNLGDVITPVVPVSFKLDVDNKSYSVMSRFIVKGR